MEDLRVLLFFYILEGALVGFVGLALIGIKLNLKQFITVGIVQGLIVYLIRALYTINNITFGTHTFFNLLGLIIILYLVARKGWGISILGALLGFIILILSESLIYPLILTNLQTTLEKLFVDTWLHIVTAYIGDGLLIAVALFLAVSKRSLIKINDLMR